MPCHLHSMNPAHAGKYNPYNFHQDILSELKTTNIPLLDQLQNCLHFRLSYMFLICLYNNRFPCSNSKCLVIQHFSTICVCSFSFQFSICLFHSRSNFSYYQLYFLMPVPYQQIPVFQRQHSETKQKN